MIQVRVFLPPLFSTDKLDERGWLELENDAQLKDLLRLIKMPKVIAKALKVTVNAEQTPLDTILKDGDVAGFFWLLPGG